MVDKHEDGDREPLEVGFGGIEQHRRTIAVGVEEEAVVFLLAAVAVAGLESRLTACASYHSFAPSVLALP